MGWILNLLTFLVLSAFVTWQVYEKFNLKPEDVGKTEITNDVSYRYSLALKGNITFLKLLLEKGYTFSYSDGKVFILLPDKSSVKELLNLYEGYRNQTLKIEKARFVIRQLIKTDIGQTEKKWLDAKEEYSEFYKLLKERGIEVSFKVFKPTLLSFQREVFNEVSLYWENKYKQLLDQFKEYVEEPLPEFKPLLSKAKTYFGDDLKTRLFKLYLKKLYYETRLEADLFKYKQYGSSN